MDKIKSSTELTRADDRGGEIVTTIEYVRGMPSTLRMSQKLCGQTVSLELVGREIAVFVAAMREFKYLVDIWERENDDDE
jgi:hypothetical protein